MKANMLLIGGAPTVGKSYTARKIAEELKVPWISTDAIREQMREIVRKEDYPQLFKHFFKDTRASSKEAVKFLTSNTSKQIVEIQNKESEDVWKGVKAFIETDYVWGKFIIEGVAILPKLAHLVIKKDKRIRAVFLIDNNIDRIKKTVFTRGLWDDAKKYPDSVKEKEIEWVIEFNKYIKKEAKKYNLPVLEIKNRENYISKIKDIYLSK